MKADVYCSLLMVLLHTPKQLTSGPNHGQLELATAPGKAVNTWTQGALELGILRYQHQSADESPTDQFTFVVSDG